MYEYKSKTSVPINCNLENDLLLSLLSHSKIDLRVNQYLRELHHMRDIESDSTLSKYEEMLLKVHQMLDRKTSNCNKLCDYIHRVCDFEVNCIKSPINTDLVEESEGIKIDQGSSENLEKVKVKPINFISNERKKHTTKRDKSRCSMRIITQSKSITKTISKFKRSSLSRYHHLDRLNSNRTSNLFHNTSSRRHYNVLDNNKKNNKEHFYCYCKKGAFGKMIACDNSNCKIEWFHNKCVNVIDVPNGEWFCPECRPSPL